MAEYAIEFGGSNDYISIPALASTNNGSQDYDWEFEFTWAMVESDRSSGTWIRVLSDGSTSDRVIFKKNEFRYYKNGGYASWTSIPNDTTDSVVYKVKILANTNFELLVDTVSQGEKSSTSGARAVADFTRIGTDSSGGSGYAEGQCEYFKYTDNHNSSNSREYLFNEGSGSSVADELNSQDGTLTNFPGDDSQWILLSGGGTSFQPGWAIYTNKLIGGY